jgi:mitochondrial fission protein ELM1
VTFTPDDAVSLAKGAVQLAKLRGGSILATTSRRTGDACADALEQALQGPYLFHRWRPDADNPYLGFLGHADAVVVSADSASMCTEACALGKPVFLHRPAAGVPEKFKLLHERLMAHGCLKPLGSTWFEVETAPENAATAIAAAIRRLFPRRNGAEGNLSVASRAQAS